MKKVLLLIVAIVSVLHASAQEVDSLQVQSTAVSIDSLSIRLNKLQHDYDFMFCDFELHKMIMDLKDLSSTIDISSERVLINYYSSRYNHALYNAYVEDYESCRTLFDSLKDKIKATRTVVLVKIALSGFSELEQNVINAYWGLIDQCVIKVEKALDYYDVTIDAYRSKR